MFCLALRRLWPINPLHHSLDCHARLNAVPTSLQRSPDNEGHEAFDQADSDIPEPIEVAVEEYTNWHLAKVRVTKCLGEYT